MELLAVLQCKPLRDRILVDPISAAEDPLTHLLSYAPGPPSGGGPTGFNPGNLHIMNPPSKLPAESSNYRPGEPHRSWGSGEPIAPTDAELIIQAADSFASLRKLIQGSELEDQDLIAFGRLNSYCALMWYVPMVSLIREPRIDPDVLQLLVKSVSQFKP